MGWKRWRRRLRQGALLVAEIDRHAGELVKVEANMARALNDREGLTNPETRHASDNLQPVFRLAAELAKWIPG